MLTKRVVKRITIPARCVGVTLRVSEKALREIREMQHRQAREAATAPRLMFR